MDSIISWLGLIAVMVGVIGVVVRIWVNSKSADYWERKTYINSARVVDFSPKK